MDDTQIKEKIIGKMFHNIPAFLDAMSAFSLRVLLNSTLQDNNKTTTLTTSTSCTISEAPEGGLLSFFRPNTTQISAGGVEDVCGPSNPFMLALPWIRITFGILMMLENSLSLMALWRVKRMQHAVYRFISSLAVAELLMGVWCCYRYGAEILTGAHIVTIECRLRFVGDTYLNFAAILSVVALCLDRCIALQVPFRYLQLVSFRRVRAALVAVWVLPGVFVLTAYLDTTESAYQVCSFVSIASKRTYTVLTVVRCLLISLIIVSQLLIFRSARYQIVKISPTVFSTRNSNRFLKMNIKAAVTTLAVVVPFLLLYFPVLLVQGNLAVRTHLEDSCQSQLLAFVWLCASAHGLFTPIIFCWRFTEVRQNLVSLLTCWTHTTPQSDVFNVKVNDSGSSA